MPRYCSVWLNPHGLWFSLNLPVSRDSRVVKSFLGAGLSETIGLARMCWSWYAATVYVCIWAGTRVLEPDFRKSRLATQLGLLDRALGSAYSLLLFTELQFGLRLLFECDLERDLVFRERDWLFWLVLFCLELLLPTLTDLRCFVLVADCGLLSEDVTSLLFRAGLAAFFRATFLHAPTGVDEILLESVPILRR